MPQHFSGARLADARQAAGLRREAVAVAVDRSLPTIVGYELGRIDPPASVVGRLADAVGCAPGDLYERGDK
jgi:transcriptional regulator with XRE-family HTH domain